MPLPWASVSTFPYAETPAITKAMRIEAMLGPVTIGGAAKAGHPLADPQPGENIVRHLVEEALR